MIYHSSIEHHHPGIPGLIRNPCPTALLTGKFWGRRISRLGQTKEVGGQFPPLLYSNRIFAAQGNLLKQHHRPQPDPGQYLPLCAQWHKSTASPKWGKRAPIPAQIAPLCTWRGMLGAAEGSPARRHDKLPECCSQIAPCCNCTPGCSWGKRGKG